MKTRIIELIITDEVLGTGKESDPYRRLIQLWTKDGELIAEQGIEEYDRPKLNLDLIK